MTGKLPLLLLPLLLVLAEAGRTGPRTASWLRPQPYETASSDARNKRFIHPGIPSRPPSKAYQACLGPDSKPGHCRHVSSCGDAAFRANLPRMMQYMCVIEKEFIGICCPDDLSGTVDTYEGAPVSVIGLAGTLPAVAIEGEDAMVMPGEESTVQRGGRASRGCGLSTRDQSRVTGGRPTSSREWPWVAAMLRAGEQYCGGVLITDRHILTAAHCVHKVRPRELLIRLGEYDLRYPNETRALDFKVVEIRIHSGYVPSTYKNDIAIVKIYRPTIFSTYIWPVCLPPVGAVFENRQATVIGWGTTSYGGAGSYVLKEVTVPVWPQDKCVSSFTQEITARHICAGDYNGNGDACQGDSGGPLMYQLSNGRWVNIGIVSWGIGCGNADQPGIYTRVNAYLDWIFANTIF